MEVVRVGNVYVEALPGEGVSVMIVDVERGRALEATLTWRAVRRLVRELERMRREAVRCVLREVTRPVEVYPESTMFPDGDAAVKVERQLEELRARLAGMCGGCELREEELP